MALARKLNGEIISADSMQVYRGMDIGTAKPTRVEQKRIRHHLIDILDPSQSFSVYKFYKSAVRAVRDISRRGKLPVIAGGTGLYVRSLLQGFEEGPGADPSFRKKLQGLADEKGREFLYEMLKKENPDRAAQVEPNNIHRVIRALEIAHLKKKSGKTGKPPRFFKPLSALGFETVVIGIMKDRASLYSDIEARVDLMFRRGWVREARRIFLGRISTTASQALGYKEIRRALESHSPLTDLPAEIKQNTRRFAKRQLTWFRKEPGIRWFEKKQGTPPSKFLSEILQFLLQSSDIR